MTSLGVLQEWLLSRDEVTYRNFYEAKSNVKLLNIRERRGLRSQLVRHCSDKLKPKSLEIGNRTHLRQAAEGRTGQWKTGELFDLRGGGLRAGLVSRFYANGDWSSLNREFQIQMSVTFWY